MRRRDIPTALIASAVTAAVTLPRQSQAQTACAPPCYPETAVESAAGVNVVNTSYLPGDVRRYGAVGDGKTDDTSALKDALSAANEGGYVMYLPAGTYLISSQLQKLQSFTCPNIRGDGYHYSRVDYSSFGATAAIYIQGGSGSPCGAVIEGVGFDGSASSYGLEVDGQDGLTIRDCEFSQNAVGLRLNNMTAGAFTECTVAENCVFGNSCATALQYVINGGNASFNGSGLRHCLIQDNGNAAYPIHIGSGASPYNAPLSFEIWAASNGTVIWNESTESVFFHGTITVEGGGSSEAQCPVLAGDQPVYLVGGIESAGYVNYGTLLTGSRAARLGPASGVANGQHLIRQHPSTIRTALTTGSNVIAKINTLSAGSLFLQLYGPQYDYRYILVAAPNGYGGAGYVQTISALVQFNGAGYGPPSFTVDSSGNFLVSNGNFPSSGVTAFLDVVPMGLSPMAYSASVAEYGNV